MPLTKQQLFAYHELGWVVVKSVVDAPTIPKSNAEIAKVDERFADNPQAAPGARASREAGLPAAQPKRILQLVTSQPVSPTLNAVIHRPNLLEMLTQIRGPRIKLFHSNLLMNAPHVPGFSRGIRTTATGIFARNCQRRSTARWQLIRIRSIKVICTLFMAATT